MFAVTDPEAELEVGQELVTSAYSNGQYPEGIPIGTVADVGESTTALTRDVTVRPFVDFTRLHEVLVIIDAPIAAAAAVPRTARTSTCASPTSTRSSTSRTSNVRCEEDGRRDDGRRMDAEAEARR